MDLNFETDLILENDKVILRPLVEDDFNNLSTFSINEPEL